MVFIKGSQGHKAEVREGRFCRCYAAGFDDGRRSHGPMNAGGLLETGKDQETDAPSEPTEKSRALCHFEFSPTKLFQALISRTVR